MALSIVVVCLLFLVLGRATGALDLAALGAAGVLVFVIGIFSLSRGQRDGIDREARPRQ
jgi:hypothetical protein